MDPSRRRSGGDRRGLPLRGDERRRGAQAHRRHLDVHQRLLSAAGARPPRQAQAGHPLGDLRPLPVAAPAAGQVRVPHRRPRHGSDVRRPRAGRRGRRRGPPGSSRSTGSTRTSRATPRWAPSRSPTWTSATPRASPRSARTRRNVYGTAWLNLVGQYLGNGVNAVPDEPEHRLRAGGRDTRSDRGQRLRRHRRLQHRVGDTSRRRALRLLGRHRARGRVGQLLLPLRQGRQRHAAGLLDARALEDHRLGQPDRAAGLGRGAGRRGGGDQHLRRGEHRRHRRVHLVEVGEQRQAGHAVARTTTRAPASPTSPTPTVRRPTAAGACTRSPTPSSSTCSRPRTRRRRSSSSAAPGARTRARFLPSINKYAQENDVTVFNFDTILDGGVVGGGNTATNPLQARNPAANSEWSTPTRASSTARSSRGT